MSVQVVGVGQATGGKPINLTQLLAELETASVDCSAGLGLAQDYVYTYDNGGQPADFPAEQQATVDSVIAAHTALRDKTDEEYALEFQNPATTAARKQEIRDQQSGLLPREQVPMA
jgi:hypothetical protein